MKHMKDERILIAVYMLVIGCVLIRKESLDWSPQKKPENNRLKKVEPSLLMKRNAGISLQPCFLNYVKT